MSDGHPTTLWGKLLGHFPHAGATMAIERILEFLLGAVEHDFAEIRADINNLKWAPFKRAEESLLLVKALRESKSEDSELTEREYEFLNQAMQDFRLTAATLHETQRCKAKLAAVSCAHLMGKKDEAKILYDIARNELAEANTMLYTEHRRMRNRAKRFVHGNLRVSKNQTIVTVAGLVATGAVLTAAAATIEFTIPFWIGCVVFGTAATGGRLTEDHAKVVERLHETFLLGNDVFRDANWKEPEKRKAFWQRLSAPSDVDEPPSGPGPGVATE